MSTTEASAPSPWVTGGGLGSKNAVLVFRTSALANITEPASDLDSVPQLKPLNAVNEPRTNDQKNLLERNGSQTKAPSASTHFNKRLRGKPNGSLSSSENSISSFGEESVESDGDGVGSNRNTSSGSTDQANPGAMVNSKDDSCGYDDDDTYISEMPAAVLKLTYKFTNTETKLLKRILSSHGLEEANESQHFNLLWTGLHMKPDILRNLTPYQRINHFPR